MVEKMTVKEVAEIIGKPQSSVRLSIKQGTLPFGLVVKQKRWSYWISKQKFEKRLND